MLVLLERSFTDSVCVEVVLHDDHRYSLRYGDAVFYRNDKKTVNGRTSAYAFRSVEQLRYDFERDVAAAGGKLG